MKLKNGFALIVILGLLGVLAFISMTFIEISGHQHNITSSNLLKVKSNALAQSGFEYAVNRIVSSITSDFTDVSLTVSKGTFLVSGDTINISALSQSGRININDGIQTGKLEVEHDPLFETYYANALDPYPNYNIEDPIRIWYNSESRPQTNEANFNQARSGLINLRTRRILNAYGDVHRFIDHLYEDDYTNIAKEEFSREAFADINLISFTSISEKSADMPRGASMAFSERDTWGSNNALGDHIIEGRPQGGFKNVDEAKEIINNWALNINLKKPEENNSHFSSQYLNDSTFFDLIRNDLTTFSYEDTSFFRIDDELRFGDYQGSVIASSEFSIDIRDGRIIKNTHGQFKPKDLQMDPPDFTNMWLPHSVPLINISDASFFTRAAVFYAPTNVSYSCEGATTSTVYIGDKGDLNKFGTNAGFESMIALPSIGVGSPVFEKSAIRKDGETYYSVFSSENKEHNHTYGGSKTHLISLRDALELAYEYENYGIGADYGNNSNNAPTKVLDPFNSNNNNHRVTLNNILNFDEFFLFLKERNYNSSWPGYEKAKNDRGRIPTYPKNSRGLNCDFKQLFYVSPRDLSGVFVNDYVERTFPHIFSCIRRIPSYLGAPIALQSPYIMLKPAQEGELNDNAFADGEISQLPFRKIEDFVWRFTQPKICFLPNGHYSITSKGTISSPTNEEIVSSSIDANIKLFETYYYRSQKQFESITDRSKTHQDIVIGPEFSRQSPQENDPIQPSDHLGFVGLKDFEDDLAWEGEPLKRDYYMTHENFSSAGGYSPQIVLNFNPDRDPNTQDTSFKNLSQNETIKPELQDPDHDMWAQGLTQYDRRPLEHSHLEGIKDSNLKPIPLYGTPGRHDGMCDLSPFGGLLLTSMNHGEFAKDITQSAAYNGFSDSAYWRLDDWLTENPVGQDVSSGIMTFWFQMPSGYDFPTPIYLNHEDKPPSQLIYPQSFTRVLCTLNLWEKYETNVDPIIGDIERPVSLVVGLKKTQDDGQVIFARYDSGDEPYWGNAPKEEQFQFTAPLELSSAPISPFSGGFYNTLNFWCDNNVASWGPKFDEADFTFSGNYYRDYRSLRHRSVEVRVPFNNRKDLGPGSWHRVSVFWNFRFDPSSPAQMKSYKQLYIDLHDGSSKNSYQLNPSYHQSMSHPYGEPSFTYTDPFLYPNNDTTKAQWGFTHPFDSMMTLSLGEAHARHQIGLLNLRQDGKKIARTDPSRYFSAWRLNSSIDNFRLWMGPSDPNKRLIPDDYFDVDWMKEVLDKVPYSSMRYKVLNTHHHSNLTDDDHEPHWVINPQFAANTKILSLGTRIYYPPGMSVKYDPVYKKQVKHIVYGNCPYVRLKLYAKDNEKHEVKPNLDLTTNEQDFFYSAQQVDGSYRISLQYKAHVPYLDGDLNVLGDPQRPSSDPVHGDPLLYSPPDIVLDPSQDFHFTDIPYIKEISLRYILAQGMEFFSLEQK